MGFEYSIIRRAAYHPAPGSPPLITRYKALPFPEQWRDSLLDLCNATRTEDQEPFRTVPTYRMDAVLQTLAPDLIVRGRGGESTDGSEDFWLYAPADEAHPLPGDTLQRLITVWLQDLRGEPEHRALLTRTLDDLNATPPTWEDVKVDLLGCCCTVGGTAAPTARQFQLATDYLARRIVNLEPYDTGAETLTFRAVPRGPRQQGSELMSQPIPHEDKDGIWWFSVVLNISLHTVPFSPLPRLHLHTSIRRWATRPHASASRIRLPFGRDTSVYLLPTVPWLPGAPRSRRFAVARLTWDRDQQAYDWRGRGPAGILRRLTLNEAFPEPHDLLTHPAAWIGDGPGVRAAIVYSTHMGEHGVGPGFMSHQRSQITAWAEQALPDGLVRAADLRRSWVAPNTAANARTKPQGQEARSAEEARAAHAQRTALAHAREAYAERIPANGGTAADGHAVASLEVRLLWQTEEMRDAMVVALAATLGLAGDGGAVALAPDAYENARPGSPALLTWRTPEITVRLRCLKLIGGLAEPLGIDPKARPKLPALSNAINTRRSAMAAFLQADSAEAARPSLALVEINRRADFPTPRDDPKFALRLGCADAGVITQFAALPKTASLRKNAAHRARSAWQDGLRQLGVRVLPQHTLGGQLPADLQYAAIWMVKRRGDSRTGLPRHVPVAVLVQPNPQHIGEARIRGWDPKADNGVGAWIPYPHFLLRLTALAEIPATQSEPEPADAPSTVPGQRSADGEATPRRATYRVWRQTMNEQRRDTARYLQRMLRSTDLRARPTILMAHSQNSRSHWPWLQDGKTVIDQIRTGHAPAARLTPELRLIRVRSASGRETPQWWGLGSPTGINGLSAGLWTELIDEPDTGGPQPTAARVFYSTTEKASTFKSSAVEADKLAPRPLRAGPRRGQPTIDTGIPAWNPTLVEITVLGCHPDERDDPHTLALAAHQLRQAPDYLDALSLPLPLHLAGLAQEYVLPTLADDPGDDEGTTSADPADAIEDIEGIFGVPAAAEDESADPDPDQAYASGLAQAPKLEGDLVLFGS
ncbi:pPIWI_RE module domain-containing protein [Frankia sp. Cj3]|uniref:pPIWI_RE module domain-containing protein n=1 Tax=Frankia sp. Cj3 TaxID=2880976 RepID=UPI001EF3F80B|nr:DUF3962 domain-containing protein [Frankia sp. Cj3]